MDEVPVMIDGTTILYEKSPVRILQSKKNTLAMICDLHLSVETSKVLNYLVNDGILLTVLHGSLRQV